MSVRRTITTIAVAATTGGLALGGGAVATASPGGTPRVTDHPGHPCGRTVVQSLTTTLSTGDPQAMTLDVTLNQDVGRLVAVVANADGVLEYGPLAPVSGSPGSYTGVFVPPSGAPVANGDRVLVIACGDHWLTMATVGTAWAPTQTGKSGDPGRPTTKAGGPAPGSTEPTRRPEGPPAGSPESTTTTTSTTVA